MAQLQTCKSPDCGRGVERTTVTDDHGHTHPRVRVRCAPCGIEGEWQVDDSLTRAIVAWNERHLPAANHLHDTRAAEEHERALVIAEQRKANAQRQIEVFEAELAHALIKEKVLRKADDAKNADTFAAQARFFADTIAQLKEAVS